MNDSDNSDNSDDTHYNSLNMPYLFYMASYINEEQIYLKFNLPLVEQQEIVYTVMKKHFGENYEWDKSHASTMLVAMKGKQIKIKDSFLELFIKKLSNDGCSIQIIRKDIPVDDGYIDECVIILKFEGEPKILENILQDKNKYYLRPSRYIKSIEPFFVDCSDYMIDKEEKLLFINFSVNIECETYNYIKNE